MSKKWIKDLVKIVLADIIKNIGDPLEHHFQVGKINITILWPRKELIPY